MEKKKYIKPEIRTDLKKSDLKSPSQEIVPPEHILYILWYNATDENREGHLFMWAPQGRVIPPEKLRETFEKEDKTGNVMSFTQFVASIKIRGKHLDSNIAKELFPGLILSKRAQYPPWKHDAWVNFANLTNSRVIGFWETKDDRFKGKAPTQSFDVVPADEPRQANKSKDLSQKQIGPKPE